MNVITCLEIVSATCWMGNQGLRDCDYMSKESKCYLLDGEAEFDRL